MTILTNENATTYVTDIFASWGYQDLAVTGTAICADIPDDAAIDVTLNYTDDSGRHTGTMTVWIETNGSLYGEW
jgi:hypothetical protein